jgi:hypothetical protein
VLHRLRFAVFRRAGLRRFLGLDPPART